MLAPLNDLVNSPAHYTARGGIEPVDFIVSNGLSYLEGNIIKYVHRYPYKGHPLRDLLKARACLERLIRNQEMNGEVDNG